MRFPPCQLWRTRYLSCYLSRGGEGSSSPTGTQSMGCDLSAVRTADALALGVNLPVKPLTLLAQSIVAHPASINEITCHVTTGYSDDLRTNNKETEHETTMQNA